ARHECAARRWTRLRPREPHGHHALERRQTRRRTARLHRQGRLFRYRRHFDQARWQHGGHERRYGGGPPAGWAPACPPRGRKAKVNAAGAIGIVENMPDGKAQRPGDIVTTMSGQTIEIINTDAEGRLVLSDLLHYVNKHFKPKFMIDLATLTGAIIVALGQEYAGLFANDDRLAERLVKVGNEIGERGVRKPPRAANDKRDGFRFCGHEKTGGGAGGGTLGRRSCGRAPSTRRHGRPSTPRAPPWAHRRARSTAAGAPASACGCWTGWWPNTTRSDPTSQGRQAARYDGTITMTEIVFYQLQRQPLERVLPTLIEKSLERGWRVVVQAAAEERVEARDAHLGPCRDDTFLPHGTWREAEAREQPILFTRDGDNPNGAAVRFLIDGAPMPADADAYQRIVLIVDGEDPDAVAAARARWSEGKAKGLDVTYWRAGEGGGGEGWGWN